VVLFNMGGPSTLDEVEPFLTRLFSDREIIQLPFGPSAQPLLARLIARLRGPSVRRNYDAIGGGSPQLSLTRAQAWALEQRLNEPRATGALRHALGTSPAIKVVIAMRYSEPSAGDALRRLKARDIRQVVTVPLYPHWSKATTGSSQRAFREALDAPDARRHGFEELPIDSYADDPFYLNAFANTVRRAYARLSPEGQEKAVILFSAHGLPQRFVDDGDPYVEQIQATRAGLLERLRLPNRQVLGYQSRTGPVKWIGPGTEDLIEELASAGVKHLLVVPLSFVSDHIETLYEIDLLFRDVAAKAGIVEYVRPEALNTHPIFIEALARLVERRLACHEQAACSREAVLT
jgi:ferrochelatase